MSKFERATSPDDPERCQATGGTGQCPFKGQMLPTGERSKFCPRHGAMEVKKAEKESLSLYHGSIWQAQIGAQASHASVKSLREEIGILRVLMTNQLNLCKDATEMTMRSSTISELATKIQVLVASCHKVEKDLGVMLDKAQAVRLANEMVELVGRYVQEPEILEFLQEDLLDAVQRISQESV
jgi:hypothetical protein